MIADAMIEIVLLYEGGCPPKQNYILEGRPVVAQASFTR